MGKILAIGVLLIATAVGLGADFSQAARNHPPGAYSLGDHLAARKSTLQTALADLVGASTVLPPAPAGWSRHAARYEDALRAYAVATPPESVDAGRTLEKSILDKLPGYERHYLTYENGDRIIVIDVTIVPPTEATRRGRAALGTIFRRLAAGAKPFMTAGGIDLASVQNQETGSGRMILGQIEDLVYVNAASNADETTTRKLLDAIDFAALHKMAARARSETAQSASASDAPPRPGAFLSAGDCIRKGAGKFCSVGN